MTLLSSEISPIIYTSSFLAIVIAAILAIRNLAHRESGQRAVYYAAGACLAAFIIAVSTIDIARLFPLLIALTVGGIAAVILTWEKTTLSLSSIIQWFQVAIAIAILCMIGMLIVTPEATALLFVGKIPNQNQPLYMSMSICFSAVILSSSLWANFSTSSKSLSAVSPIKQGIRFIYLAIILGFIAYLFRHFMEYGTLSSAVELAFVSALLGIFHCKMIYRTDPLLHHACINVLLGLTILFMGLIIGHPLLLMIGTLISAGNVAVIQFIFKSNGYSLLSLLGAGTTTALTQPAHNLSNNAADITAQPWPV